MGLLRYIALQNSSFDETLINRERGIILHKTEEMRAQTEEVIFDHLHSTAFQYTPPPLEGPFLDLLKTSRR